MDFELERKIRDIVDKHIVFVEYEGYEIDRDAIIYEILHLIENDKQRKEKDSGGSAPSS